MEMLDTLLKLAKTTFEATQKAQTGEVVNVLFECSNGDVMATFRPYSRHQENGEAQQVKEGE